MVICCYSGSISFLRSEPLVFWKTLDPTLSPSLCFEWEMTWSYWLYTPKWKWILSLVISAAFSISSFSHAFPSSWHIFFSLPQCEYSHSFFKIFHLLVTLESCFQRRQCVLDVLCSLLETIMRKKSWYCLPPGTSGLEEIEGNWGNGSHSADS